MEALSWHSFAQSINYLKPKIVSVQLDPVMQSFAFTSKTSLEELYSYPCTTSGDTFRAPTHVQSTAKISIYINRSIVWLHRVVNTEGPPQNKMRNAGEDPCVNVYISAVCPCALKREFFPMHTNRKIQWEGFHSLAMIFFVWIQRTQFSSSVGERETENTPANPHTFTLST